jgi:hypothetical protein
VFKVLMLAALLAGFGATSFALAQSSAAPAGSPIPENPTTTAAAKSFYQSLVTSKVDRSHLSSDLNTALTDDLVATLSKQLTALGTPTWTYLRTVQTNGVLISKYRLGYNSGAVVYYSFGITDKGTIFTAFLGNSDQ